MTARILTEKDEPAFQRLLRAVYGETYSYRELCTVGGYAALLARGAARCWGDVADDGELHAHTAFLLKDPRGEYTESGMSLRNASLRSPGRSEDGAVWRTLLEDARRHAPLLHQNTTTRHPLAQRYAVRHLGARPTGFILAYTRDEQLIGLPQTGSETHALTMTTVLADRARPIETAALPSSRFAPWLEDLLARWGIRVVRTERVERAFALDTLEENASIGLRRRAVSRARPEEPPADILARRAWRTELIHVPCDERLATGPALEAYGYVPVGLRPHARRPSEVIFQQIADRADARERLRHIALVGDDARAIVRGWCEVP
jgi:hypothetical protein